MRRVHFSVKVDNTPISVEAPNLLEARKIKAFLETQYPKRAVEIVQTLGEDFEAYRPSTELV